MPRLTSDNPESVITRVVDSDGDEAMAWIWPAIRPDRIFLMTTEQGVWLTAGDAEAFAAALGTLAADLRGTETLAA